MIRVEFTKAVINLISGMFLEGESPIIDFVKRSNEEQMRLYLKDLSKCDGVKKISQHQLGKAIDIYFVDLETNKLCDPKKGWEFWHEYWETKGGKPVIIFSDGRKDNCHFEV